MVCSSTLTAMGGFHIVGLLQVEGLQPTSAYQITDMLLLSTISEPPLKQLISVLGTDYEGRDILTRLIYGGRVSLAVSVLSVLLGTTVGALWGVASAYIGGRFDMHSQRLLEIFMSFPPLVLAMLLVIGMGSGLWAVVIAIGITRLPFGVRVVRSVALAVKELAYVESARAIGASTLRIMVLYIAPQCLAAYLVLATAQLGVAIVIEASLGFLGV